MTERSRNGDYVALWVAACGLSGAIFLYGIATLLSVQPTVPEAPRIGPQPTFFQAPCGIVQAVTGSCIQGYVDAKTFDQLRGGDDI